MRNRRLEWILVISIRICSFYYDCFALLSLRDKLGFVSWSYWTRFIFILRKLLLSFFFYQSLWLSLSSKLSFWLFFKFSRKFSWLRTGFKGMTMFPLRRLIFKPFRFLIRLIWFILVLIINFLKFIDFKYFVCTYNSMKDIFSLFIRNSKRGSSFLSGWYFNANYRKAFLISLLFAVIFTPRIS